VLVHQAGTSDVLELRVTFARGMDMECPVISSHDSCKLALCGEDSGAFSLASAGAVSASSAAVGLQVSAAPDATQAGGYPDVQQILTTNLKGGETIRFAAAGGDVPAFSRDLAMPTPLVLLQPTSTRSEVSIARSGAELTWPPGEAGTEVHVSAFGSGEAWTTMTCSWDANAGAGSIPGEILSAMPDAQQLFVSVRRKIEATMGNFVISWSILSAARSADSPAPRVLVLADSL
jgi:hypothetical protein